MTYEGLDNSSDLRVLVKTSRKSSSGTPASLPVRRRRRFDADAFFQICATSVGIEHLPAIGTARQSFEVSRWDFRASARTR